MMRWGRVMLAAVVVWCLGRGATGAVPFEPSAEISRPRQTALIAYDGTTEILLLSTDLRASKPTTVLEVLPFPSRPTVSEGDVDAITRADRHVMETLAARRRSAARVPAASQTDAEAADKAPEKKIQARQVGVVRFQDLQEFVAYAEQLLAQRGVAEPKISLPTRKIVEEYLDDGYEWFALSTVELGTSAATVEAVQYSFQTPFLYYPLRIRRADAGLTSIRLVLLSPRLVTIPEVGGPRVRLMPDPIETSAEAVKYWSKDAAALLDSYDPVLMRIWQIKGRPSSFRRDVATTWH